MKNFRRALWLVVAMLTPLAPGCTLMTNVDGCAELWGTETCYLDQDGDGYGDPENEMSYAGRLPEGCVLNHGDFNDADASVHPGAPRDTDGDSAIDSDTAVGDFSDHEGIAMVYIPPGTFTMGSSKDEVGRDSDEGEHHEVTLTRGYYIGVYEVTQDEFEGFMGYQPSYYPGCGDCPAENMEWYEAAAFANTVSAAAGLDRCYDCSGKEDEVVCDLDSAYATPYDCQGYRLPTEAEWEYAARAGTESAFSNGGNLNSGDESECAGNLLLDNGSFLDDIAVYCGNHPGQPGEVGTKESNPWGLYDMHGNVWESCHDWYDGYEGDAEDPQGASDGSSRVKRGGSWNYYPRGLRSAVRGLSGPGVGGGSLGFRLARSE